MTVASSLVGGHASITIQDIAPRWRLDRLIEWFGAASPVCKNLRMDADSDGCGRGPDSQYVELAVEVFAMLADATRVRIILALNGDELSVNQLADIVDKTPAAVSQHLAKLRLARFVTSRQEGTRVFYRLANEHARQLVSDAIFQAEHSLSNDPRHHHHDIDSATITGPADRDLDSTEIRS